MDKLTDLIHANEADDPTDTANAVCAAVGLPTKWRDLFFDLLRDECRRRMRVDARSAEASSWGGAHTRPDTHPGNGSPREDRTTYLSTRFATGDGRFVLWGEATIDDHRMRMEMLTRLRNGLDATIARHQSAIDLLVESGARCLNDLGEVAAA